MSEDLKRGLLSQISERLLAKIDQVKLAVAQAEDALHNESKSSAGDKYETSREMIQQDLTRYQGQLQALQQEVAVVTRVEDTLDSTQKQRVTLGHLVLTDRAHYFIAVAIGKLTVNQKDIFVISAGSPIGQLLSNKTVGEEITFNGIAQRIVQID